MTAIQAYIGLGSNLTDSHGNDSQTLIRQALSELAQLPDTQFVQASSLYRSTAVGPGSQPDYINAVAQIETSLPPLELLDRLQAIEQSHERVRNEHWGARTLDLDLLLYGEQQINHPRLSVPHPYLSQRNFVLYPLAEITPNLILPLGESLGSLLALSPESGLSRLASTSAS